MKMDHLNRFDMLAEANITDRILKEPGRAKMLAIAWRHDHTLPPTEVSKLGPKPDEKALAAEWSNMLEQTLARTNYGDLSRDFKFADWLTRLYTSGQADWEDISGEGGDALGAWHALSTRGLLDKPHQDLNSFKTLKQLQRSVMSNQRYSAELQRIKNAAEIAKMKKDKKDLILIDDDRFWVAVPFNYGACYVFNNTGHISTFCTGGSSGLRWFNNYAPDGIMVMIADKANIDSEDGKWQMHAKTDQLVNSVQNYRYDKGEHFGELYPGLMRRILKALAEHAAEIKEQSRDLSNNKQGYDVRQEISLIKGRFPKSLTKSKDEPDEPEAEEPSVQEWLRDKWYREFLDPGFTMDFDPATEFTDQTFKVTKNDGQSAQTIRGRADGLDDIMNKIRGVKPDWLVPGSITSVKLD